MKNRNRVMKKGTSDYLIAADKAHVLTKKICCGYSLEVPL